jgi:hypothetical protein
MSKWTPIESPPKDGTKVLAWFPEINGCSLIWWNEEIGNVKIYDDGVLEIVCLGKPTHWMPLPEGPEATVSKPGRKKSPTSIETLKPWVAEGTNRTDWYFNRRVERLVEEAIRKAQA